MINCSGLNFCVEKERRQWGRQGCVSPYCLHPGFGRAAPQLDSGLCLKASTHTPAVLLFTQLDFNMPSFFWAFVSSCDKKQRLGGISFGMLPHRPRYLKMVLEEYPVHMGIPSLLVSKYQLVL